MLEKLLSLCVLFLVVQAKANELRVAAASDLKFVLPQLINKYREQHPEQRLTTSFAASGILATQIINEAPFDIFLSADSHLPEKLFNLKKTEGELFPFAVGSLVLFVRKDSKVDLDKGLDILVTKEIKKIAIANPAHAPYGLAAMEAILAASSIKSVQPKLVIGENVGQAAQFIQSGAADIGLVSLSLAMSQNLKDKTRYKKIEAKYYKPLVQTGAILKRTQNLREACSFRDFLLSAKAQGILAMHGYTQPPTVKD